jgi:putative transcriptional regulator
MAATRGADIARQIAGDPDTAPDVTTLGRPVAAPLPQIAASRVRSLRRRTGLTQAEFAGALRIPLASYRNWEQGRTKPDPAARSLLHLVERDPGRVLGLLAAAE